MCYCVLCLFEHTGVQYCAILCVVAFLVLYFDIRISLLIKRCLIRLFFPHLFVGGLMSYLYNFCLRIVV